MYLKDILDGIIKGKEFELYLVDNGWTDIDYNVLFNKLSMNYTGEYYDDPYIRIKSDFNVKFDKIIDELEDYVHSEFDVSEVHREKIANYLDKLETLVHNAINKGEIK